MPTPTHLRRLLLAAGALALSAAAAGATDYALPPEAPALDGPNWDAPTWGTPAAWYGPSPFAAPGSAYGLSGFGYYYDQPTEHRLGPPPGDRYGRRGDPRRRAAR